MTAVSFIGGGNQSTRREPLTCRKSLTNFIMLCCIEYSSSWAGFKLTTLVVIGTDCIGSCKSNYHTITTMPAPRMWRYRHHKWIHMWKFDWWSALSDGGNWSTWSKLMTCWQSLTNFMILASTLHHRRIKLIDRWNPNNIQPWP